MKVTLTIVPPGGGEADYHLAFDLPAVPQPGDYVSVKRPGEKGLSHFIVRRSWWMLSYSSTQTAIIKPLGGALAATNGGKESGVRPGKLESLVVECELADGPNPSDDHKRACARYKGRKGKDKLKSFDESCY